MWSCSVQVENRLRHRRGFSSLLGSTAFTGAFVALIAAFPQSAWAACLGENSGNVLCDAADPATGGTLTSSFAGTTVVTVNPGGQIDTGPAFVTVTAPGSLTFTNNDTTFGIPNGVALSNNFGDISYIGKAATSEVAAIGSGNVSVSGFGTINSTTVGIDAVSTGAGDATINYNGTITAVNSALNASVTDGSATVTGSGNVTSAAALGSIGAVVAVASGSGNALVAWNGAVNQTGSGAALSADSLDGAATVNVLGNVTSTSAASTASVTAATLGGPATVNVAAGVTIGGGLGGIDAESSSGKINVDVGAGASVSGSSFAVEVASVGQATTTIGANAEIRGGTVGILEVAAGGSLAIGGGTMVTASTPSGIGVAVESRANFTLFNAGSISGSMTAIYFEPNGGLNTLTLAPTSVISGQVVGGASPFQNALFGGAPGAADTFQLGGTGTGTFDISQLADAGQYSGFGTFNKVDSSTWNLTGTSSFSGPITISGGVLAINGDVTSTSGVTVTSGGTLAGNGILSSTQINGGTLSPGNSIGTLTVSGSLTMTAASTYLVQISGAASDKTIVTGAATLGGKVTVDPLAPLGITTTYTIVNARTLTGSFDSVSIDNFFARNARLSYVGNDVLLTLDPGLLSPILPGNAGRNQRSVAGGIDNAIIGGATPPTGFNALYLLSGDGLLNALKQASGETGTGSQQATFDAMNLFMGVLTDPFTAGRGVEAPGATGYADEGALDYTGRREPTDAFAMLTKAPPRAFEARWNVWGAGYGGAQTTGGNAALGSNNATSSIGGFAVGADYRMSPNTVAGFALAGGGTAFSVAGGGSGRSDLFQAGAFVRHSEGSAYVTAALAYGWQDITTDRVVMISGTDHLHAEYDANSVSARIEAGNRYVVPDAGIALTPYAAVQVTAFDLPSYGETADGGTGTFALNYAAKTATATRSELGLRSDKSYAVGDAILTLRGRAAWAHDYDTDRNVTASFQTLPGSSFIVNGAAAAHDAALTTASAEMKFASGISVAATFEGEFSDVTASYAGKGVVRYNW